MKLPPSRIVRTCALPVLVASMMNLFGAGPLSAQDADSAKAAQTAEAADLAKQIQNPLASVVTLPFQVNFNEGVGEFDRRVANLNFQPVIPFPGEKWNLVSRSIIPYISLPQGERQAETGFGDMTTMLFASPAKPGAVIWGVGPVLQLPTASNPELLGSGKTSMAQEWTGGSAVDDACRGRRFLIWAVSRVF